MPTPQPNSSKPSDAHDTAGKNEPTYPGPRPNEAGNKQRPNEGAIKPAPGKPASGASNTSEPLDSAAEDLYDNVACTD